MILITVSILRGSKNSESAIGIQRCQYADWLLVLAFIIFCVVILFFAVKYSKKIYALKHKYQKGMCQSDIFPEKKPLTKLLVLGFVGGWISGALGIGGGTIFNPVFISMNMTP